MLLAVCCLVVLPLSNTASADDTPPPSTIVSLTFDDGFASQWTARQLLLNYHTHGTFYVPSGMVGLTGRLTSQQLQAIQADGNEIGGHTVNHVNLPTVDGAEQARQICDDRVALSRFGLDVSSFAYPYDAYSAQTEQIAKNCGYNSARAEAGLFANGACASCSYSESTPPADPYALRTATPVVTDTRLSAIEQQVSDARSHGGGWVPLVFHEVCDACSTMAIAPHDLEGLLSWLQSQAGQGVVVQSVNQVIGGAHRPLVSGPVDPRPDGQLVNPSLEDLGQGGTSTCWQRAGYGDNSATWSRVPDAHSGSTAEQVTIRSFVSGDLKLVTRQDSGSCSPAVRPGETYTLSAWYKSTIPTRMVAFYRSANGAWKYWTESGKAGPAATWELLSWRTPPIPDGATRLSFGLQATNVGSLTIDDFGMNLTRPASSSTYPVGIAAGVAAVVVPALGLIGWARIRRTRT